MDFAFIALREHDGRDYHITLSLNVINENFVGESIEHSGCQMDVIALVIVESG